MKSSACNHRSSIEHSVIRLQFLSWEFSVLLFICTRVMNVLAYLYYDFVLILAMRCKLCLFLDQCLYCLEKLLCVSLSCLFFA